jgi:hypothetical protein
MMSFPLWRRCANESTNTNLDRSQPIAEVTGLTISELEGFANDRLQQLQSEQENDFPEERLRQRSN